VRRAPETEPNAFPDCPEFAPGTGIKFIVKPLAD